MLRLRPETKAADNDRVGMSFYTGTVSIDTSARRQLCSGRSSYDHVTLGLYINRAIEYVVALESGIGRDRLCLAQTNPKRVIKSYLQ